MKKLTKYCSYIAGVSRAISGKQRAEMTGERRDDIRVKHGIMFSLASLLLLSLLPGRAFAAIDCASNMSGRTTYVDYHVPLLLDGIQVSALRNSPVGTVLWSQSIKNPDNGDFLGVTDCIRTDGDQSTITLTLHHNIEGSLPAIVGTWRNRNIYDTSIPGLGLVIASANLKTYPFIQNWGGGNGTSSGWGGIASYMGQYLTVDIFLVKTGDIPAGTWSVPISVPPVTLHMEFLENASGPEVTRDYGPRLIIESGSINVVSGTCQTPDVNVAMGRHNVSDNMENTPWVDFAIELNNCPPMFGFYKAIANQFPSFSWDGDDNIVLGSVTPNTVNVLFNPVYGFSEMPSGEHCANIAPTTDAASGVCLEIQDKSNIGVLEKAVSGLAVDSGLNLLNSVANYSIPLRARYVRTAGSTTMTAGRADSAVEFTINYY
ncbi:hypothetical protein HV299_23870 [Klebsiella grimontii]|uniref:hypothetical protein n=2 Tax=Klebsiella grimontii TaxID=2058152 RepID=UPI0012B7BE9B|nr:hypothetical protein [Klebsiella grimontii]MBZ7127357.1 hypothetical protein [Klebsiella grimontii]MBZ7336533.1 hypothetical protein [Klebsiella grimontii]MDR4267883.1 hypothetical protein [Klebsiella grimontii]QLT11225.1 hypothetical protein HV299_23870 [Klebsiella grimontii]